MSLFSDKAVEAKQKKQKLWTKVILFIGAGSFAGTAMVPVIGGIIDSVRQPTTEVAQTAQVNQEVQLKQQEAGFLAVLEREPNNTNALQGLVQTRLALGDLEGARPHLQRLVELFPDEQVLKDLLAEVDKRLENSSSTAPAQSPTEAPATP
ncbi:MAG: tetratricopeptide repeat protein [Synechococcus sp.]|nr:tetratricopeptide repeat protein [Synechococcus sp.]